MARKKKFVLKLKDDFKVHDLDELRREFDGERVMMYFRSGELVEWLSDRYYDDEAEQIGSLDVNDPEAAKKLCAMLDVNYEEYFDAEFLARINEKEIYLKSKTDDATIIGNARITAFNQEDLADLLDMDEPTIYLYGDNFNIPIRVPNKHYIGVLRTPTIKIRAKNQEELDAQNIVFENVMLPWGAPSKPKVTELKQRPKPVEAKKFDAYNDFLKCKEAAEAGNTDAMYYLAKWCTNGEFVQADPKQAKEWMLKAAEAGDTDAMSELADWYTDGKFVQADPQKAKEWMKKAAEVGNIYAMGSLASWYMDGTVVQADPKQAKKWMLKAAEAGDTEAMRLLADWYKDGTVVQADPQKAKAWMKKAVEASDTDAIRELADWYTAGTVVQADPKKAQEWKTKIAEHSFRACKLKVEAGDIDAMFNLVWRYKV